MSAIAAQPGMIANRSRGDHRSRSHCPGCKYAGPRAPRVRATNVASARSIGRSAYFAISWALRARALGESAAMFSHPLKASFQQGTAALLATRPGKQVHRPGECRLGGDQREAEAVQDERAHSMISLVGIDQRHQRAGVGERHAFEIASLTISVNASPVRRARRPPPCTAPSTSAKYSLPLAVKTRSARSAAARRMNSDSDSPCTAAARCSRFSGSGSSRRLLCQRIT